MDQSTAYDADILEWSQRQASALRDFARTHRELSNELDWEHVAEEIEDVGRSELMAVQSLIRQILIHVIKAVSAPDTAPILHWRKEVVGFHNDLLDRISPSMPARIALDVIWQRSIKEADAALAIHGQSVAPGLPVECPLKLDDIAARELDFLALVENLRRRVEECAPQP